MTLQTIPRAIVGGTLRAVRLPIDGFLALTGSRGESAKLAVDRADATARTIAGAVLRDRELVEDADRRHQAAAERQQAANLHAEAELREERAEQEAEEVRHEAQGRRRKAAEKTQQKRRQAQKRRESTKAKAKKKAEQREERAEEKASKAKEEAEEKREGERLGELEAKADALEAKEEALTAAEEGQRLKEAAGAAKAARKNGSS
jgi:colicin import membrane protein